MSATSPNDTGIDLDDVVPAKGTVWNNSERRIITMDGLWH
jgi:hypothetical protein